MNASSVIGWCGLSTPRDRNERKIVLLQCSSRKVSPAVDGAEVKSGCYVVPGDRRKVATRAKPQVFDWLRGTTSTSTTYADHQGLTHRHDLITSTCHNRQLDHCVAKSKASLALTTSCKSYTSLQPRILRKTLSSEHLPSRPTLDDSSCGLHGRARHIATIHIR